MVDANHMVGEMCWPLTNIKINDIVLTLIRNNSFQIVRENKFQQSLVSNQHNC